ncbi:hypothetical protein EES47_21800 [Streptomyces sp. ADI98-12]|nr:hypothetical protein EES47_21800 [Streptomyces sp. ADI98-12]
MSAPYAAPFAAEDDVPRVLDRREGPYGEGCCGGTAGCSRSSPTARS